MAETKREQVVSKGKEIQEYMEKHNIQIRGQESSESQEKSSTSSTSSASRPQTSGVLVQN